MDTQILRKPAAGQVWRHANGAHYHVIAVANEEHKHEDHPVDVVYRSMRQDNGQPSHWWTRPLATWHEKMTFVAEHNEAVPSIGIVREITYGPQMERADVVISYGREEMEEGPLSLPNPGTWVRIYPTSKVPNRFRPLRVSLPDECAATSQGHLFGPYGPKNQTQCRYCGEPE